MTLPTIDAELTEQDLAAIEAQFASILASLPFLVGLSPEQRKRDIQASDNDRPFISKSFGLAQRIEDHLPRNVELADLDRQLALVDALHRMQVRASQLAQLLSDTRSIVITQAYAQALDIYRIGKRLQGTEGTKEVVADLGRRFHRPARRQRKRPDGSPDGSDEA